MARTGGQEASRQASARIRLADVRSRSHAPMSAALANQRAAWFGYSVSAAASPDCRRAIPELETDAGRQLPLNRGCAGVYA
jgi:hypothetical protein